MPTEREAWERMWALLKQNAKKDGKLEERVVKRKSGDVTVATPYGIRYRQLQQYLAAMEHRQLHKRPTKVSHIGRPRAPTAAPVRPMI